MAYPRLSMKTTERRMDKATRLGFSRFNEAFPLELFTVILTHKNLQENKMLPNFISFSCRNRFH